MGEGETGDYLGTVIFDAFKREIDADDSVWRTLPFFAAIIGLAVAVLPAVYRATSDIVTTYWRVAGLVMFGASIASFAIAGYWFWRVIRPREYIYPPPADEILAYATKLKTYYEQRRMTADRRDRAVRDDLRAFMVHQYAEATANNRRNNNARAVARSQVLIFVMAGFLLAFLCEGTTLAAAAFSH